MGPTLASDKVFKAANNSAGNASSFVFSSKSLWHVKGIDMEFGELLNGFINSLGSKSLITSNNLSSWVISGDVSNFSKADTNVSRELSSSLVSSEVTLNATSFPNSENVFGPAKIFCGSINNFSFTATNSDTLIAVPERMLISGESLSTLSSYVFQKEISLVQHTQKSV